MRVSQVRFERTKSEPGYNNTKIGVTVDVSDGEDAQVALNAARYFVKKEFGELPTPSQIDHAKQLISECEGAASTLFDQSTD